MNRAAFIIANENTQTAVCALRSDLLVGWQPTRLNSRYLMLKHFVDENTGQVFERKEDVVHAIVSQAPPTWGRFVGNAIELTRRITYTHRRSLSKAGVKKLKASREVSRRQTELQQKTTKGSRGSSSRGRKNNKGKKTKQASTQANAHTR